jgi:hypothetical protein
VLVIDDDPASRDLLERALVREGYAVETAGSGAEALERAHLCPPDAITLDVLMPEMDGWSVLAALKSDPELARIPVILVTMVEEEEKLGRALGAVDYLVKPVDRAQLVEVVGRHVARGLHAPVLIVEDDAATRELLVRTVHSLGLEHVAAENGRAALARVLERTPQLILLDLLMPEMDGFAFLAALREKEAWRSIPVVVVTSKALSPEERAYLEGAAVQVLAKTERGVADLLGELRALLRERTTGWQS